MIQRTKNSVVKFKEVENASPLAGEACDLDNPNFVEKLKSGFFEGREDLPYPKRGGPHYKFKNDFMRQVYYLSRLGAREVDVAQFFGVQLRMVQYWKEKNKDFQDAWEEGHWLFGMKVGETLGQKALGYDYTEVEYSQHVDRQGNIRDLKKVTHKHMPPSDVAIIFYLKNRFRDMWMDVNRTEVESRVNIDITKRLDMSGLTEAEQKMIKSIALKSIIPQHGVSE
jgi:hypothetical protein